MEYTIIATERWLQCGKERKAHCKIEGKTRDFTFEELETLLGLLGFEKSNKGKTSGSRVLFRKGNIPIAVHKPHPRKELLEYQIKQILEVLEKEKLI